jgi:PAS domain S-box-containing protein
MYFLEIYNILFSKENIFLVIKCRKQPAKKTVEDIIVKFFMEEPLPMAISRAKDGTYVEVNNAALKIMGLPRKKVIGHTSMELGFFSPEMRKLLMEEIRLHGFAKNVPGNICINNQVAIRMLFKVFPVKMGRETFLMIIATDVSNHQSTTGKLGDEKIFTITRNDEKFIKEKLKQYHLSPRQQEIALLSSIGLSNGEIAKKLFISSHTVKDHQKEIFRIIGIHSRNEIFPKLLNFC